MAKCGIHCPCPVGRLARHYASLQTGQVYEMELIHVDPADHASEDWWDICRATIEQHEERQAIYDG